MAEHKGVCVVDSIPCDWEDGKWVHLWPTQDVENWIAKEHPHEANPGWDPVES